MTPPNAIQTESTRTPNASRAGALHSHIHIHIQRQNSRPKAASMTSGRGWPSTGLDHHQAVGASVMDGHFVASDGGVR